MPTLTEILKDRTRVGTLFEKLDGQRLRFTACGHLCRLPEGKEGVCKVRFNRGGTLMEGEISCRYGFHPGYEAPPISDLDHCIN